MGVEAMKPAARMDEAVAAWERGDAKKALALTWDAVNSAMDHGQDDVLMRARDLADAIAAATGGKLTSDAEQLASYCRHCLAGVGNGTQSLNLLALLTNWRRRKCPDCAESIAKDARVCPHCGYRLAAPPAT